MSVMLELAISVFISIDIIDIVILNSLILPISGFLVDLLYY